MRQLNPAIASDGQQVFRLPGLAKPAIVTVNSVIIQPADFVIEGESVTLVAALAAGVGPRWVQSVN